MYPTPGPEVMHTFSLHTDVLTAGRTVIAIEGELDLATAPALDRAVDAALADGAVDVILDLGRLSFVDCRGLACLLSARRRVLNNGGTLLLGNVAGEPRRLLDLTGTAVDFGLIPPARRVAV
jgi:anti-sigma B factor antagonist